MTHSFEHHLQDSNVRVIGMWTLRNLSVYSAVCDADPMKVPVCVPEVKTYSNACCFCRGGSKEICEYGSVEEGSK